MSRYTYVEHPAHEVLQPVTFDSAPRITHSTAANPAAGPR